MKRCTMIAVLYCLAVSIGLAGPQILTYQGQVLNPGGSPVPDSTYQMRFRLYDAAATGTLRWTEPTESAQVTGGLFSTVLGDGNPFGSLFSTYPNLWLEVAVDLNRNGSIEASEVYSPRQRMASAAWAVEADRLQGRQASAFAAAAHQHPATDITSGRLPEARIDNAIARDSELPPRSYDAIVAHAGGDYTSVSAALLAGRKTIFVRNGTYVLGADIEITQSGTTIVGESRDGVIIDCNGPYRIRARGSASNYTAGTISVNSGSTAVTGVGTAWLNNTAAGEYIRIGDDWYRIGVVVANDVLTLENAYEGPTRTGYPYNIAGYLTNLHLENLTVQNYSGVFDSMIDMQWVLDCSIRNCRIQDSPHLGLYLLEAHRFVAKSNIFQSTWMGIRADQCSNSEFIENLCTNSTYGIFTENATARIKISGNHCSNNSQAGIMVEWADNCTVSGNVCSYNTRGISIASTSTCVAITGNACAYNISDGIDVSRSEMAAVSGNVCRSNRGIGISIWTSHRSAISGNTCTGNIGNGIQVRDGDENAVVGNTSTGNGGYGIEIMFASSANNVVGSNILTGNTSGAGLDGGTTTRQKPTNYPAF